MDREQINLSIPQQNILTAEQFFEESTVNNNCAVIHFKNADIIKIQDAVNDFIENTQAIRLAVIDAKVVPESAKQEIKKYIREELPVFAVTDEEDAKKRAETLFHTKLDVERKLYAFEIYTFENGQADLACVLHHLIADGYGYAQAVKVIAKNYESLLAGKEPEARMLDYTTYIENEEKGLHGKKFDRDEKFWQEYLKEEFEPARCTQFAKMNTTAAKRVGYLLDQREKQILEDLQKASGQGRVPVLLSLYGLYFAKLGAGKRVAVGSPYFNRFTREEEEIFGVFVTMLPVIFDIKENMEFAKMCRNTAETSLKLLRHQRFPYQRIQQLAEEYHDLSGKLYNVIFNYIPIDLSGVDAEWMFNGTSEYELGIHVTECREGDLRIDYDYLLDAVKDGQVEKIHQAVFAMGEYILADTAASVTDVPMLYGKEREAFERLNNTFVPFDESLTVQQLFEQTRTKNKIALVCGEQRITYKELHEKTDRIALALMEKGIGRNQIVAVSMGRSANYILAVFGILKAGAAFLPIDDSWPKKRKEFVYQDSGAAFVLTDSEYETLIKEKGNRRQWSMPDVKPDDLCYVIYTSGSTGVPKGVLLTQKNAVNFSLPLERNYLVKEIQERCKCVLSIGNLAFDISISEYFPALLNGRKLLLASDEMLDSMGSMVRAVRSEHVDCMQLTPSRLAQYLEYKPFAEVMPRMKVIMAAAEVFPDTLAKRIKSLTDAVLLNGYGPTETTMGASYAYVSEQKVTIGKPISNVQMYVLNKFGNILPSEAAGELCIGGNGVGKEYLNLPELTSEKFIHIKGIGRLYRTGDLAKWTDCGEIEFLGRMDRQIKLRGLRIEIPEIENAMRSCKGVTSAAARLCGEGKNAFLAGYYTTSGGADEKSIRAYLSERLTWYMVPAVFCKLEKLPQSSNGKIDYKQLPDVQILQQMVPCSNDRQRKIFEVVAKVLENDQFGITTNLFHAGLTSLLALKLNAELAEALHQEIGVNKLMRNPTIEGLEEILEIGCKSKIAEDTARLLVDTGGKYPLMGSQMGVWIDSSGESDDFRYHMPVRVAFSGKVVPQKLKEAVENAVAAHPYLLGRFVMEDGKGYVLSGNAAFHVALEKTAQPQEIEFIAPFHLLQGPLIRAAVYYNEDVTCLYLDVHHILCDGQSMLLILKDIERIYMGGEPVKETQTAFETAVIEAEARKSKSYADSLQYYKKALQGVQSVSGLRADRPGQYQKARRFRLPLSEKESKEAAGFCRRYGVSEGNLFLAALQVVISRYTGSRDLVIAVAESGRNSFVQENSVGMYVRTVLHRMELVSTQIVAEYVKQTADAFYSSIAHDLVPYSELVGMSGFSPEILFVYQNQALEEIRMIEDGAEIVELESSFDAVPKFPVSVEITGGRIRMEYDAGMYEEETIRIFSQAVKHTLLSMLSHPLNAVKEIALLSDQERIQIAAFNQTDDLFSEEETLVSVWNRAAAAHRDETALICQDTKLDFGEFDCMANRIACALIGRGVKKGDIVIVQLPRKIYLLPALFGVLKAGAAYLPLSVDNPKERVAYIRQDSGAVFHISEENIRQLLEGEDVCLPDVALSGRDLCYIIYTSGSTGKPKGVMTEHRNVLNYAMPLKYNHQIRFICEKCHASVAVGSLAFDIAVAEFYPFLLSGKPVLLADDEEVLNPRLLADKMTKYHVDFLLCTPTRMQQYLEDPGFVKVASQLKAFMAAGEALGVEVVNRIRSVSSARIYNGYGPTETTAGCTFKEITDDEINIGPPLSNVKLHILDCERQPLPVGVAGELFISGAGVARGYLNRPQLTEKLFIKLAGIPGSTYKSGDLCDWTKNGDIQYIGRMDHQVKLRGLRIELGEIESALGKCPGVDACAVLVQGSGRAQYLCAYVASAGKKPKEQSLRRKLKETLADYMVPSVFVYLDRMPMNANGKTDRKALGNLQIPEQTVPCKNETQKRIQRILSRVMGVDIGFLGSTTDLYRYGMTSLLGMQIAAALSDEFGVSFSSKDVMRSATIEELEKGIAEGNHQSVNEELSGIQGNLYPLSGSQMGIYAEYDKAPDATNYNMPSLYDLGYGIEPERLKNALITVVGTHPYLKSVIVREGGGVFLKRGGCEEVVVHQYRLEKSFEDYSSITEEEMVNGRPLVRPFVLESGPLYRLEIYEGEGGRIWLFTDFHHIIFDGFSNVVFLNDLKNVYEGKAASAEAEDVFEGVLRQESREEKVRAKEFFDGMFQDVSEGSRIFFNGQDAGENKAAYFQYEIPKQTLLDVQKLSRKEKVSPASVWFSAFLFTVSKFGNSHKVAVGTVEDGRHRSSTVNLTGMFVNTLPFCISIERDMTAGDFLRAVHEKLRGAVQNSAYSYADFVSDFGISLDTHFVYNERGVEDFSLDGRMARGIPVLVKDAKFAFTMSLSGSQIQVDYRAGLYDDGTVRKFISHMLYAVTLLCTDMDAKMGELSLADDFDRKAYQALNETDVANDHKLTMDQMFYRAVSQYSDRTALVCAEDTRTYAELGRDATKVAAGLYAKGIRKGDVVAFCLPRSIGTIQAIFGILCSGAAVLPMDITWPKDRLSYVVENSGAKLLITEDVLEGLLSFDEKDAPKPELSSEDLCYVIYTSGSTGRPKGAMLIQRNLTNFLKPLAHNCLVSEMYQKCESILSISNITFDISICEIFPAVFFGRKLCFADDKAFDSPRVLAVFARKNEVDCIQGTPSRIAQYLEEEDFTKCLRNVKVMLVAGEALNHALADKLHEYTDSVILNGYGPTETTLAASYQYVTDKKITIGRPVANAKMYVTDEWQNLQPQGVVGELCIGGCNVGTGYINKPELTKEKFIRNPFQPGMMYRSGDLARLTDDGEIDFLGRMDSQVKLHGLRIELDEIEAVMAQHPLVTSCAAKVCGNGKNAYLCGYYTASEQLAESVLRSFLAEHLTYYMIPAVMVQLKNMPVSTAGKIDRQNLPDIAADEAVVPCETKIQEEILDIAVSALGSDDPIGITTNLFRLGMTSLLAVKINAGLYQKFGVDLSSMDILKNPTVIQLEQLVKGRTGHAIEAATNRKKQSEYPLTDHQMGVYVESLKVPDDLRYNMPAAYRIQGPIDVERLVKAVQCALGSHKSLFAYVKETPDGPVLVRNDDDVLKIPAVRVEDPDRQEFVRAFDLTKPPLIRFAVFYNDDCACLYMDAHHIIFDGESLSILMSDIKSAYEGSSLAPEELDAYEYSLVWEQEKDRAYAGDLKWLLGMFDGEQEVTAIPQQKNKDASGAERIVKKMTKSVMREMFDFEKEAGVTASATVLAAFTTVLSRITHQNDIVMAAVWDGRDDRRLQRSVGMFVRTLPLCIRFQEGDTVSSYTRRLQQVLYDTALHSSVSYADFCSQTSLAAQVLYVYQNHSGVDGEIGGYSVSPLDVPMAGDTGAKFPVVLNVVGDELILEYDSGLYAKKQMEQILSLVLHTLGSLCTANNRKLCEISICTQEDLARLAKWNETDTEFPHRDSLVSLFEKQVDRTPDHVALIGSDRKLTYKELNRRANRIAHSLIQKGVQKEDIIAVRMKRTTDILAVFLGIMKAGAAYLPLDIHYPDQRVAYCMEDSKAKLLIDDASVFELVGTDQEENPGIEINSSNLCYIIYTSGSTGMPKGVMTLHRGVMDYSLPLTYNLHSRTIADKCEVSLAIGSLAFDIAVAEIYPFLLSGKTVVLAGDEQSNDVVELAELVEKYQADAILCTPSRLLQYLEYEPFAKGLEHFHNITAAGEAVPMEWLTRLKAVTRAKLYNGYGPTEATCGSLFLEMNEDYVNIGKPLSNEKVFVVDQWHNLLPPGIAGELCISGYGLARGYLHRQDLTDEKFIHVPYVEGRMYCTGDMARWNDRGEIEFIGRIDHQVKFHGYRIELGEIEQALALHPDVENCAVLVKDTKGGQVLAAYYTAKGELGDNELADYLESRLPHYMVPDAWMRLEQMPLDLNAKIDRRKLPEIAVKISGTFVPPENERERAVCEVFGKILGMDAVSADASFFVMGGDSIKGIRVVSELLKYGFRVPMRQLFETPSARALAPHLEKAVQAEEAEVSGNAPLSAIQRYFFDTPFEGMWQWNQSVMFDLGKRTELETVSKILDILCSHHDELRAVFYEDVDGWKQEIPKFQSHGACFMLCETEEPCEEALEEAQKSLSLNGRKLAAVLIHGKETDRLFLTVHHLVVDTVSWRILAEDFTILFEADDRAAEEMLQPKTTSYAGYVRALSEFAASGRLWADLDYWRKKSSYRMEKLPQDFPLAQSRTRKFQNTVTTWLEKGSIPKIIDACKGKHGAGMNELLIAALSMAMKHVFGIDSVSYLLEGHGREDFDERIDVSRTVGWFTSFYPISLKTCQSGLDLFQNVIEELRGIPRSGFSYPVLKYLSGEELPFASQVLVNYLGEFQDAGDSTGVRMTNNPAGKWDLAKDSPVMAPLSFTGAVHESVLMLTVEYDNREYKEETIQRLVDELSKELLHLAEQLDGIHALPELPSDFGLHDVADKEWQAIQRLAQQKGAGTVKGLVDQIYPANDMQAGMLLLSEHYKEQALYHEQLMLVLPYPVDAQKFEARLKEATAKYEALRSLFVYKGMKRAYQVVCKDCTPKYQYMDISKYALGWKAGEEPAPVMGRYLKSLMSVDRYRGFTPDQETMFRCMLLRASDEAYLAFFSFSHVILDKWSMDLLLAQLLGDSEITGTDPYRNYVTYQMEQNPYLALDFWKGQMSGAADTVFPKTGNQTGKPDYASMHARLNGGNVKRLQTLSGEKNVTVSTMVQYAFADALMRVLNTEDVSFGYTWSGRPGELADVNQMVGMFIRTLPVRVKKEMTLEQLQKNSLETERFSFVSAADIQKSAHLKHPAFRYFMTFQNTPAAQEDHGIYELFSYNRSRNEFSIFIQMDETIEILVSYDRDLFSEAWVEHLTEEFLQSLQNI